LRTSGVFSVHNDFVGSKREMSPSRARHNFYVPFPAPELQAERDSVSGESKGDFSKDVVSVDLDE
jgi:hypothetical protein